MHLMSSLWTPLKTFWYSGLDTDQPQSTKPQQTDGKYMCIAGHSGITLWGQQITTNTNLYVTLFKC